MHVQPVPHGMTWEDAFYECVYLGGFVGYTWWKPRFWRMRWVVVRYDPDTGYVERV